MKIMVTGAAGNYGSLAIDYIKQFAPDTELYGLIHDPSKASALEAKGVNVRVADYADKSSLVKAFEGIDRLLFVSVPVTDLQKNVVAALRESNISYVAYTSIAGITANKFGLQINHAQTENMIANTGIAHTFLRNNWYLELDEAIIKAAVQTGKFYYLSDKKISWTLRREYAEAGAKVILGEGYPKVIELTRNAVTYPELASAIEQATSRNLDVRKVTPQEFEENLSNAGIDNMGKALAMNMQNYAQCDNGEEHFTQTAFEQVLGHPLSSLADSVKELLDK